MMQVTRREIDISGVKLICFMFDLLLFMLALMIMCKWIARTVTWSLSTFASIDYTWHNRHLSINEIHGNQLTDSINV